ncbi:MAG: hypothetical protein UR69_C0002G0219 [Candidatus Moranbacteria bacterium GW2011_GWE2_35_2-]|nr:MAG: hypothetical protein UR69_C0002G0219 [Candidatus Moranbacteria bacterium GW2011_GWE2_35_2-]KKQ06713.1 MAG: hypothetical protein US15_C0005G0014 [Candidatus Moranbacteria bacterium GW2011_GWF1_36_4]KKQ22432.1 MAG: hypothetical protein US37_C0002G0057 [Candidatus Moranbacteria bacterium GW2011_GWF2_37_11]KKQ29501.1 MAG: hypothetical protein US44_C0001G0093 [Candidatus Moranbacteria bacterium GW2011_GWD1_37_17]KKQ30629.1 MAG: hypothetical protein US47_C0002G0219 [Candidatus Moranbacteria b
MKKILAIIIFVIFLVGLNSWVWSNLKKNEIKSANSNIVSISDIQSNASNGNNNVDGATDTPQEDDPLVDWAPADSQNSDYNPPLLHIDISKKPFGILVSSENSPVSPEKFSGYHTGTDFEIAMEDSDKDVSVFAVCSGDVESVKIISGYGGVMVQKCTLNDEDIRVLYGHINIDKIFIKEGEYLPSGKEFAILADNASELSGGERKHLHLGIWKGTKIDVQGYVQNESELSKWIDFETVIDLSNT